VAEGGAAIVACQADIDCTINARDSRVYNVEPGEKYINLKFTGLTQNLGHL
jgi:hypothetical protein